MKMVLLLVTSALMLQSNPGKEDPLVRIVNYEQLSPLLSRQNDTVYLVNFWATWCGPCRKEMPAIEAIAEKYKSQKFKVLLVSLDFRNTLDASLLPYLRTNAIKSEVVLLDDPYQDHWINDIDPDWDGDLPFTIVYGRNFREYFARSFTFEELDSIIHPKLKYP